MSMSKKRSRQRATFIGAVIGLVIIFTFVISLLNPDLGSNSSGSSNSFPTGTVIPTPDPDPQIEGELPYIHSSGYFQTFRPAGADWEIKEALPNQPVSYPSVYITSGQRVVVIHHYVQRGVIFDSLDALSQNYLTAEYFANQWQQYDSWGETGRQVMADGVVVSFDLTYQNNAYLGRDISWLDGSWLYVTRLVVPANNGALLDLLHRTILPSFIGYHDLQQLSEAWKVYIDQELGLALKHPFGWNRILGNEGSPVTFSLSDEPETTVRLSTTPDRPIDSEDAANAWVIETRSLPDHDPEAEPTVTIHQTNPVEREIGGGYQVSYTYQDATGDLRSGLAVLLNDTDDTLYVANLDLDMPDVDLLAAEGESPVSAQNLQALTAGFVILPPEALMAPPPVEAATPAPGTE